MSQGEDVNVLQEYRMRQMIAGLVGQLPSGLQHSFKASHHLDADGFFSNDVENVTIEAVVGEIPKTKLRDVLEKTKKLIQAHANREKENLESPGVPVFGLTDATTKEGP